MKILFYLIFMFNTFLLAYENFSKDFYARVRFPIDTDNYEQVHVKVDFCYYSSKITGESEYYNACGFSIIGNDYGYKLHVVPSSHGFGVMTSGGTYYGSSHSSNYHDGVYVLGGGVYLISPPCPKNSFIFDEIVKEARGNKDFTFKLLDVESNENTCRQIANGANFKFWKFSSGSCNYKVCRYKCKPRPPIKCPTGFTCYEGLSKSECDTLIEINTNDLKRSNCEDGTYRADFITSEAMNGYCEASVCMVELCKRKKEKTCNTFCGFNSTCKSVTDSNGIQKDSCVCNYGYTTNDLGFCVPIATDEDSQDKPNSDVKIETPNQNTPNDTNIEGVPNPNYKPNEPTLIAKNPDGSIIKNPSTSTHVKFPKSDGSVLVGKDVNNSNSLDLNITVSLDTNFSLKDDLFNDLHEAKKDYNDEFAKNTDDFTSFFKDGKSKVLNFIDEVKSEINAIKSKGFINLNKEKVLTCPYNFSIDLNYFKVASNFDVCNFINPLYYLFYFLSFSTFVFFSLKFFISKIIAIL